MDNKIKGLPIGIQSFNKLIERNLIYIDKTTYIHKLASEGQYYFISRPRRFGKTLLCTTLQELFLGNQKLFTSLAISATDYSWEKHPVIFISFATMALKSATALRTSLEEILKGIAYKYGVEINERVPSLGLRLKSLILNLARQNSVAILIDEYDAAIIKNINNIEEAEACQEVLFEFFSALKDGEVDNCLRFVFITGVSKFSKTSIFSGLNNLQDLSLEPGTALLFGYTEDEIRSYYKEYLELISQKTGMGVEEILEKMRFWYNGYQFVDPNAVDNSRVYNPYSVMLYLKTEIFDNYWFDTATPKFLMELLKKQGYPITSVDGTKINKSETKAYDITSVKLVPLLWQTGYLTIESYDPATRNYTLTFPNEEVRLSFFGEVMQNITGVGSGDLSSMVHELSAAINRADFDAFLEILKVFFAQIPYDIHIPLEKYYQSIFFTIMTLLGAHVIAEDRTNNGRIDAVVETKSHIFIFEFKVGDTTEAALQQITEKEYYQKYLLKNKAITLLGVQFDKNKRTISNWIVKAL